MKMILINTSSGQYHVPLQNIAEHRADYYAIIDGYVIKSDEWQEGVDFVLDDDYEGIDWLLNNTDWDDWSDVAVKINNEIKVSDDDFWTSSEDFKIIDI